MILFKKSKVKVEALVTVHNVAIGMRVTRGPDWKWRDQDSGGTGTIIGWVTAEGWKIGNAPDTPNWARVMWDNSQIYSYRIGKIRLSGKPVYDLVVAKTE